MDSKFTLTANLSVLTRHSPNILNFSPLRLFISLKSDVNGLSFRIFTRNGITLLNISILLQQWLHIAKVCMLRNPAYNNLRRLTTKEIENAEGRLARKKNSPS